MTIAAAAVFFLGGLLAGFLTGLLGVGGGVIMVPIIFQSYLHLGAASKSAFVTAVASSLAVIIFTGTYASWLHYRQGRLDLRLALWMGVGTLVGSFAGSHLLLNLDNKIVRPAFGIFLWSMAASLLLPRGSRPPQKSPIEWLYKGGLMAMGAFMGAVSALFGIGGAAIAVPVLRTAFGVSLHNAIAAASSMIVMTALFSSINYVITGWHDPTAPSHGIGWIDPLAAAFFLPGAIWSTRFGVMVAQSYSRTRLRNVLMLFQIVVGARFIFS